MILEECEHIAKEANTQISKYKNDNIDFFYFFFDDSDEKTSDKE